MLISYLQLPEPEFRRVLASAAAALAPGGRLFMIGHARRNRTEGVGGPQDPAVLWDPAELSSELDRLGLAIEDCSEVRRPVEHPEGVREAIDVRALARRGPCLTN